MPYEDMTMLTPVFRYIVSVFVVGLVLAVLLPEKKLADDNGPDSGPG